MLIFIQVLSDNPAMVRWADAADKAIAASEGRRREPLGGSASSPLHSRDPSHDETHSWYDLSFLSCLYFYAYCFL